jgi:hypothetical protein
MATKTFKLGEVCKGGVITAETTITTVTIVAKEWDSSQGNRITSSQANAKEFNRLTVKISDENAYRKLHEFVNDLTTSFFTDQILDWCLEKSKLKKEKFWW